MALTLAGAAFAAVTPVTWLHQTGTALTPADTTVNCDGAPALDPGQTAWHFILTQTTATSAMGSFAFSDGTQEVAAFQQGNNLAWWVITDNGATLDGSNTFTDAAGGEFNLSGACVNEATPTPTLPPTNTLDQTPTSPAGTSLYLVFGLILAVAGGLVVYAMRPRRGTR
jgi:hypothetical protein